MATNLSALPNGTILNDYKIESILGQGGFGITYLASEIMFGRKVAIKEYYPREFAARETTLTVRPSGNQEDIDHFKWGLDAFEREPKFLARFKDPHIVGVQRFFKANGTAYLVMDYCDGEPLDLIIKRDGPLPLGSLKKIIFPILDSLDKIHKEDFLHRDIKPANIFIRADGSPVLLDFGSARQENVTHSRSVTSIATEGYAALEQFSTRGRQGPFTDIYGFSSTLYRAISGVKPISATERSLEDTLVPLTELVAGKYPKSLLMAIDKGMSLRPEGRPKTITDWRKLFFEEEKITEVQETSTNPRVAVQNKKELNSEKGARPFKYFGLGFVIFCIVLILVANIGNNKTESSNTPNVSSTPTPVLSIDVINLNDIKGSWSESLSNCNKQATTFELGGNIGDVIKTYDISKKAKSEITSVKKIDNNFYEITSKSNSSNNSYLIEKYQKINESSLRLMTRYSEPNIDDIKVFNGKYFKFGNETPILVKCPQ
jgi:serine/threonine protein kinase